MMRLWKDTFADADEYINIVFGNYFNPNLCFTIYAGNKLLSSMLCVEYSFCEKHLCLKSAYQCGLATLPEFRNRGLMRKLIERANSNLYNKQFALSFLIPANDKLRRYYKVSGYVDVAYINSEVYSYSHDYVCYEVLLYCDGTGLYECHYNSVNYIVRDVSAIFNNVSKDELSIGYIKSYKDVCAYLYDAYSMFVALKNTMSDMSLQYSFDDFIAICLDNYISGGKILCLTDDNNKPLSIIFCSNIGKGSATIQLQVSTSEEAELLLLQILKYFLPEQTAVTVRRYGCPAVENREVGQKPYAMVKILNVLEVLKFVADLYRNSEFSILINCDTISENEGLYVVRQGEVQFSQKETMTSDELNEANMKCGTLPGWFALTVPELAAMLFRCSDFGFAESAAAVPRLSMTVALVLE